MENASKALIIAGAILLAILLISLGIMIYNQAQNTVNNSGMSEAELSSYNNKFLKYEGTQTGSVIKSLINEVITTNSDDTHPDITMKLTPKSGSEAILAETNASSSINTKSSYKVTLDYSNGRVSVIHMAEQ